MVGQQPAERGIHQRGDDADGRESKVLHHLIREAGHKAFLIFDNRRGIVRMPCRIGWSDTAPRSRCFICPSIARS